jgi:hypothetical protein
VAVLAVAARGMDRETREVFDLVRSRLEEITDGEREDAG